MTPLLLDALATYRLTKLVTDDQITAGLRDKVIEWAYERESCGRETVAAVAEQAGIDVLTPGAWAEVVANDPDPPKLAYLVTCPYCASVWLAAGVVLARRVAPRAWRPLAEVLALSALAGLTSEVVEK